MGTSPSIMFLSLKYVYTSIHRHHSVATEAARVGRLSEVTLTSDIQKFLGFFV